MSPQLAGFQVQYRHGAEARRVLVRQDRAARVDLQHALTEIHPLVVGVARDEYICALAVQEAVHEHVDRIVFRPHIVDHRDPEALNVEELHGLDAWILFAGLVVVAERGDDRRPFLTAVEYRGMDDIAGVQDQVGAGKGGADLVPEQLGITQMGISQDADTGMTHSWNNIKLNPVSGCLCRHGPPPRAAAVQ